jgi:hypothetical protein
MTRLCTVLFASLLAPLCQSSTAVEPLRDDSSVADSAGPQRTTPAAGPAKEGSIIHVDVGNFS